MSFSQEFFAKTLNFFKKVAFLFGSVYNVFENANKVGGNILYIIPEKYNKKVILDILSEHFKLSKRLIKNLKFHGDILLNGVHATVRQQVFEGDRLELVFKSEISENIVRTPMELDILYEDDDILAINKPSGIATHPSIRHFNDTLANGVMHYYNGNFTFRALTRLDLCTSGIVLIAKNEISAQKLSKQIFEKKVLKTYLAVLENAPPMEKGTISAPIKRCTDSIIKRCIAKGGKEAVTEYEIISKNESFCLVRLNPITGRTHQLRLHLSHISCPIYGDFMYGKEVSGQNLCLHCSELRFIHPSSGKEISLNAPLREDMKKLVFSV